MKKMIALLMAVAMCLLLIACSSGNIESFCDGYSISWDGYEAQNNDKTVFRAEFTDGVLTIEEWEYEADPSSPTGKSGKAVETMTYNYELEGNDTVIIEGETYTYEIDDDIVKFDKELMGIDSWWKR